MITDLLIFKVGNFAKKIREFQKMHKIYYSSFCRKRDNWAYAYMY